MSSYSVFWISKNHVFGRKWMWILFVNFDEFSWIFTIFQTIISTCGFGFLSWKSSFFVNFPFFFQRFLESWSSILSDHLHCLFEKCVPNSEIFRSKCGYFLDKCSIFRPFSKFHVYDVILKFFWKKINFFIQISSNFQSFSQPFPSSKLSQPTRVFPTFVKFWFKILSNFLTFLNYFLVRFLGKHYKMNHLFLVCSKVMIVIIFKRT